MGAVRSASYQPPQRTPYYAKPAAPQPAYGAEPAAPVAHAWQEEKPTAPVTEAPEEKPSLTAQADNILSSIFEEDER